MIKLSKQFKYLPHTTKARGFTLVELLVVIFILGALALTATFFVDGLDDQTRFDDTKSRLQLIRRAIIGDASRTLNGQPDISGFVADMGRLPNSLQELIDGDGLTPWDRVPFGGLSPVTIELYGGWRGPYLDTLPDSSDGQRRFRDGWANTDLSGVVEGNFGWDYTADDLSGVSVISLGRDRTRDDDGGSTEPYDLDYPTGLLVTIDDFIVSLQEGFTVRFNKPADIPAGVILRLFHFTEGVAGLDGPESNTFPTLSGVQSIQATFPSVDNTGNQGRYAAVLVCTSPAGAVYDGNCNAPHQPQVYYFTLVPRAQLPIIPWNIQ